MCLQYDMVISMVVCIYGGHMTVEEKQRAGRSLSLDEKTRIIEELWQKHAYEITGGYRSNRQKIIDDFADITGERLSPSTISNYTQKMDLEYLYATRDEPEHMSHSVSDDGSITSSIRQRMAKKRVFTNRELLELHGINPDENEIDRIISNEWSMTNANGEIYYNFQSKIIAVPIGEKGITWDEYRELVRVEPEPMEIEAIAIGKNHLGIGLADLHFGRTTREMLKRHLVQVLDRISQGAFDTVLIAQLGDAFESSQIKQSITLAGTILPSADMAQALVDFKWFMHTLIEHTSRYCRKVIVTSVCGNHSGNLEYVAMEGLKDRYSLLKKFDHNGEVIGDAEIVVRSGNDYRAVEKIGNVGIMMSHGDGVKLKDLPLKFASEYPLVWAEVEHREAWAGHRHNKFFESDIDGNVMRQFPSPKPPTDYEDKWGYNSRELIMMVEFNDDTSVATHEVGKDINLSTYEIKT